MIDTDNSDEDAGSNDEGYVRLDDQSRAYDGAIRNVLVRESTTAGNPQEWRHAGRQIWLNSSSLRQKKRLLQGG
eukprot:5203084-Pleurochrysis_carterae.AAC.1